MAACSTCGGSLPLTRRLRGERQCEACEDAERRAQEAAELERRRLRDQDLASYRGVLDQITAVGPSDELCSQLVAVERSPAVDPGDLALHRRQAFAAMLETALADERITADEESRLNAAAAAIFRDESALMEALQPYRTRFFIARVNDGRLPIVTSSTIVPKRGEAVHLESSAALLKEVVQREFQAGSRGVSFRIMKGVSYRVGATRGRMVEVGRSWETVDEGPLVVTSKRLVFTGLRRTIDIPYSRLLGMEVFSDGLQVHASGRANPPTFRVHDGPMIAAAINAAAQRDAA